MKKNNLKPKINVTIKNIDESAYIIAKSQSILNQISVGEYISRSILEFYANHKIDIPDLHIKKE